MSKNCKGTAFHQLFEIQVEQSPSSIAVVFEGEQLTYHELNVRANQLAHYLQNLGVGSEVLVGICVERSLDMLVGLLGILKAGGAYVPLDPAYPQERLAFMLEDAQVPVLLTQARLVASLPYNQAQVVCLDADWENIALEPTENLDSDRGADNLAYVIYTSGSTGKPKGVQIPHSAVVNFLTSMRLAPGLTNQDVLLAVTTITFDIATLELFLPLSVGARVVIASREVASDGMLLSDALLDSGATVMQATPATWQMLLRAGWQGSPQLKMLCGGEALNRELAEQLRSRGASLWNMYGPTETTIWSTFYPVEAGNGSIPIGRPIANTQVYLLDDQLQPVPSGEIGELYIGGAGLARGYLNRPDLTAEKFISHLFTNTRGAEEQGSREVEKNFPITYYQSPITKLYKTGDLARYLPDGNLEYLGRIDHQVKIRGFRIELGEIEALLWQHSDVQEAVVTAREDIPGDKRLVAYVVPNLTLERVPYHSDAKAESDTHPPINVTTEDISHNGISLVGVPTTWEKGQHIHLRLLLPGILEEQYLAGTIVWRQGKRAGIELILNPTEQTLLRQSVEYLLETQGFFKVLQRTLVGNLRNHLKKQLPDYMVPSQFAILKALPLTPNGKVDRKALPAPDRNRSDLNADWAAPRTPIEGVVARIWAEVLGLERVGIHDNFLELGGHSLLATQILSRVRDAYHVEIPLRRLFESPTVAELAQHIETGRQEKPALGLSSIKSIVGKQNVALSFAQQRLWFLNQLIPNHAFYNVTEAVRLNGLLNITALEQSFNEIIRRHDTLRTTFTTVEGQPVPVIQSPPPFKLPIINLQANPPTEREAQALQLATEAAQQPFNLTQGPLLRVILLQLQERESILVLTLHHILCDDWSLGVLFQELTALYEAFSQGKSSPLSELAIQYGDFAAWQRQWLQGEALDEQLVYWQQQLADLPILRLPTDYPRPTTPTYQGALHAFVLPKPLTDALKDLSRREGTTLFMMLLAAFQTLLFRYTSQEDIAVGSPIANRHRRDVEGLIGFFVNSLVLRTDLSGSPSFRQLLHRVREVALGAYAYQDVPFEKLVAELQPERDLSRQPLFQVMFALQNTPPIDDLELTGLQKQPVLIDNGTAKFDIFLQLSETPEGLTGWFEYSTDLFEAATISRMAGHFQTLLTGIVAHPEGRITDFPILTVPEQHQLLVEWNCTQVEYPQACIHQLFEAQVEQTPEAVAVVFENQQLTYRELSDRANQLAHYLQHLGVKSEVLVGICVERSLETIIGLLGILKAGGAYLPLAPDYPKERLTFMLEDGQLLVLLTQTRLVSVLPDHQAQVVCLDDWEEIAAYSKENPVSETTPDNLAYVMYTSGSTGQPKGVSVIHRGVVRLVKGNHYANLSAEEVFLQLAPISFDASTLEIWGSLLNGAKLVVMPPQTPSLKQLGQALQQYQITILWLTAGLFHLMVDERLEDLKPLRQLLAGGDVLSVPHVQKVLQELKGCQLINGYGPTENTTFTCCYPITDADRVQSSVPIGRPIANTQVYLLDNQLQPVPIGVPGEVYIGGDGLARGYLNRPDLTAEKFIPHPFITSNRADGEKSSLHPLPTTHYPSPLPKLYKTGDLARYLPDGTIEFLGRIDNQVKLRGFRIELSEIEAVLNQHPAVQSAVVLDREDVPGQKRLVAYVVQNPQTSLPQELVADWNTDYISQWQKLYDQTYRQAPPDQNLTFNIVGWNSSYTGLPIPDAEMREWLNHTVQRILSLQPSRVLEIGCGTGLLLSRIAPQCQKYWGMDFSAEALQHIERMKQFDPSLANVKLLQRMADNFEGIEANAFDTAILNSVIQYFPNIDYLVRVLEGAIHVVEPGGYIFVGDIRNLQLLQAYHVSVLLHQAPENLERSQFLARVQQRMAHEEELLIDPEFFLALQQHFPQLGHVELLPKRGNHHNELTRFRYDTILQVKPTDIPWLDWQQEKLTLPALRQLLLETQPKILGLRRVSNSRLFSEVKTLEWLSSRDGSRTVGEHRQFLQQQQNQMVDPEQLWFWSQNLGYAIDINWTKSTTDGSYDVVFRRLPIKEKTMNFAAAVPLKPWSSYANQPLQGKFAQTLVPQLRSFLQEKLPDYMVPGAFVLLDHLPLTPNGKVDRRSLLASENNSSELKQAFVAPRTPLQEQLADLWAKVLGVEKVGIRDNFFEMGGNSLLAAQLISYVGETCHQDLPVRCLFENPTVEALAEVIQAVDREGLTALTPTVDLKAEAVLDAAIHPGEMPVEWTSEPQHIFLTGATGFLGAFLLHELLEQTPAQIHCLVRASNSQQAMQKLQEILEKYWLWNPKHRSRILPVPGDLDRPLLGVSPQQFEKLAEQIDTIYHCGAAVNFSKPYSIVKPANVLSTQDILKLACLRKIKPVHYISTIGVFGPIGHFTGIKTLLEDDNLDSCEGYVSLDLGYSQSKWVAEQLVWAAKSRGMPVTVIRPGFMLGHSRTGVANTNDYWSRLIKGCIQLGSFPALVNQKQEFISVDYASRAIVHLTRQKSSLGKAFHLTPLPEHNIPLIEFFELVRSYGYTLKQLPYSEWKEELIRQTRHSQENALYPLLPMLLEKVYQDSLTIMELYQNTPDYDCRNTLDGLAGTSIICPPMDTKLLDTYFSYFIRSGFLEPSRASCLVG